MDTKDKRLIKEQVEKSNEKLNAAKSLLRDGFIDDAISRAYYSMFHVASAVLLSEGITVESHNALKTMFGLYFIKTGKLEGKFGFLSGARDIPCFPWRLLSAGNQ